MIIEMLITVKEKPRCKPGSLSTGAPGGARFLRVQIPSLPGSGKDIAEGKGVHREVEFLLSRSY